MLKQIVRSVQQLGALQLGRNFRFSARTSEKKRRSPLKLETPAQWITQQANFPVEAFDTPPDEVVASEDIGNEETEVSDIAKQLTIWAKANRNRLRLEPGLSVALRAFHPVHRIATSGELLVEMVAHFVQTRSTSEDLGGLKYRSGITMIASIDGRIRYIIRKPFHEGRQNRMEEWVKAFDEESGSGWAAGNLGRNRIMEAFSARSMDRRRWR